MTLGAWGSGSGWVVWYKESRVQLTLTPAGSGKREAGGHDARRAMLQRVVCARSVGEVSSEHDEQAGGRAGAAADGRHGEGGMARAAAGDNATMAVRRGRGRRKVEGGRRARAWACRQRAAQCSAAQWA